MKKFLGCLVVAVGVTCAFTSMSTANTTQSASPSHTLRQGALAAAAPITVRAVSSNLLQGLWNEYKEQKPGDTDPPKKYDNRNLLKYLASLGRGSDVLALQNLDWANTVPPCVDRRANCAQTAGYMSEVSGNKPFGSYSTNSRGGACVIWRSDRLTKVGESGELGAHSGGDCSQRGNEVTNGVRLQYKNTQRVISVASVHLGEGCKKDAIRQIRNWVDDGTGPKLILGDFNIARTPSQDYSDMTMLMGQRSFVEQTSWEPGGTPYFGGFSYFWHKGFTGISNSTTLDKDCVATPCQVVTGNPFSDHNAGYADLTFAG